MGEWITLPTTDVDLEQCIRNVLKGDEEYAIHDYEAPFDVSEYADVFALNAFVQAFSPYDSKLVKVMCECLIDRDENIRILSSGDYSVYYQMVDEGLYDTVPASIASYIDYGKIARDLEAEGWYFSRQKMTAPRFHS